MNQTQLQGWLASSADATKVSLRISGVILGASSFIVYFAMQYLHISLSASDLGSLATGVGMVGGTIAFVAGGIRAMAIKVGSVTAKLPAKDQGVVLNPEG